MGGGGEVLFFSCLWKAFISVKLIFSCVLALKLDKERVMEGVVTMPPPNGLKIDPVFLFLAVGDQ